MANKINVYFNEYNLLMGSGGVTYLPFVSGILSANAKKIKQINENFSFKKFIFEPLTYENLINKYYTDKPDIAVFSISMWNEQLSLKVAKKLKEKWNTLIIFGGASCPYEPTDYFKKNTFIDIAVRAEGEEAFNEILLKYLNNDSYENIPNVAFRSKENNCIINYEKVNFNRDLDIYPSPYLTGEFDYLLKDINNHNYQIIIETNRGCPFLCTYCYWGKGGSTTKYRFHSLERTYAEIEWAAKKKIEYIFNADSNFGMHKRDMDIAKKLVEIKNKYGYPEKFRTCWGKNTSKQIFQIASLLNLHDLEKGVTLARQTNSQEALKNVKRDNIKLEAYSELEKKFNQLRIPVYAEMILGLPGETNESWSDGLCALVDKSINNQIFVYQAEIYPNTELNEKSYRLKYGIKSTKIKLNEIHCSPRDQSWLQEYQEIVTSNNTMTREDWKKRNLFSVSLMLLHSFKSGFYFFIYLKNKFNIQSKSLVEAVCKFSTQKDTPFIFNSIIKNVNKWTNDILNGEGRGVYKKHYSDVYLDIEEYIFLELSKNFPAFYKDLKIIIRIILGDEKYKKNEDIINEISKYQLMRMAVVNGKNNKKTFNYNIAEYMFKSLASKNIKLKKNKNTIKTLKVIDYKNDYRKFTKFKIIRARKNDKIKNEIDYDYKELKKIKNKLNEKNLYISDKKINKLKIFEKLNKFEKYNAINIKNNRRLTS